MAPEGYHCNPLPGKTYSLFGHSPTTDGYYDLIRQLSDTCLQKYPQKEVLLEKLRRASTTKRLIRKAREGLGNPDLVFVLRTISPALSDYTEAVQRHLENLSILKLLDRRLWTSEEQYHLYMLEIEIVNRMNREEFLKCERKIAFLPHCLKDFKHGCKSSMSDIDYACRGCSNACFPNRVSTFLKQYE